MPASFSCQCTVQVKLELGHRAQLRKKPTTEGFTHDWMVFVRGPEQCEIQHFVEKVVFRLHDSFPKPKRGEYSHPLVGQPGRAGYLPHCPSDGTPCKPGVPFSPGDSWTHVVRFWLVPFGVPVSSCQDVILL